MEYRILGPLEVSDGGRPLPLSSGRQRALLAALLLSRNETVSSDRLTEEVWHGQRPASGNKALQVQVSALRKALVSDGVIETRDGGYRLSVESGALDADRFEALLARARDLLEPDPGTAAATLREALELWRGPAFADLAYEPFLQPEIARLEERRLSGIEERIEADLALGRHAELVAELETLVSRHPLRERFRAQLMLALYRSGRQAEALSAYQSARRTLVDELGIEPSPALKELEGRILNHDESLAAPPRAEPTPSLLPSVVRRRPRLLLALGALAIAGAVAGTLTQLLGSDGRAGLTSVAGNSVGVVDPATNEIVAEIPVGRRPTSIAVGEGAVWAVNAEDRTISRIDPATMDERQFATGTTPFDVVAGEGSVWVSSSDTVREWPSRISRIDPATGVVRGTIELPRFDEVPPALGITNGGNTMVVAEGAVWALNPDGTVSRIDPRLGDIDATVENVTGNTIGAGDGAIWVVNVDRTVSRIDPATNTVTRTIEVAAEGLAAVAVGAGAVWITDPVAGVVWRIDPGEARVVQKTIPLEYGVVGISFGEGSVWVANPLEGTVSRIDPSTDRVVATLNVGNAPSNVAIGGGSVWMTVSQGGGNPTAGPETIAEAAPGDGIEPLPASSCGQLEGPADASLLIVSDLPLQGASEAQTRSIAAAVRHVLEREGFRAGEHTVAYQSCDDSTAQAGGWEVEKCAANAKDYAANPALIAVIGAYNSGCSSAAIPIANAAPDGPLAMLSPSNNYLGLTRRAPGAPRGELARLYPTGARSYLRVYPPDDAVAAALAELAQQLELKRVFVLEDRLNDTYSYPMAELFEKAAAKLDVEVVGRMKWDGRSDSYEVLAQRVAATGPDGVLLSGLMYSNAGRLVEDLRAELDPDVVLLAPDGFSNVPDFLENVGPVGFGMYVAVPGVPTARLPASGHRFLAELRAVESDLNDYWALYGAQAAEVLLDAIARSDGTRRSVVDALFATEVEDGIIGSFGFDSNGDTTAASIAILRVDGNGPGLSQLSADFAEGATVDRVIDPSLELVRAP